MQGQLVFTPSCESFVEEQAVAPVDDNMSVAGEEDPGSALDTIDLSPTTAFGPRDNGNVALDPGFALAPNHLDLASALRVSATQRKPKL